MHKLVLPTQLRYSEDIDIVQLAPDPIGCTMQAIHAHLDPWLGHPTTRQGPAGVRMTYSFVAESDPSVRRKLKIEIHTREHFTVRGLAHVPFDVANPWFAGSADITTFHIEELLATKLRALYQRGEGRDLLDLWLALEHLDLDLDALVACFARYTESTPISRAQFEANLAAKVADPSFANDVRPLLAPTGTFPFDHALATVSNRLVACLPGAPWRGTSLRDD